VDPRELEEMQDPGERVDLWVPLVALVHLECLVMLENKDLPDPQAFLESREQEDKEVPQVTVDPQVPKECLDQKDKRDQLVLMDHPDPKVLWALMDHLATEDHLVYQDQQDLLVQEDPWEHKEKEESQDPPAKKDHLDHLDYKDHPVLWDNVEREVKRVPLEAKVLPALVEDLETRVLLDLLVQWDLPEPQGFLDLWARQDHPVPQVLEASGER
jgi:hypothetical protein